MSGSKHILGRFRFRLGFTLVLIAVCAAYSNHFQNGFHFDDFHTVTDNPAIRDVHNIPKFFTDANTFSILPANRTYRPVVSTSLALDYRLGRGYNVFWFHLSTFFCFLIELIAIYFLSLAVLKAVGAGALGQYAALFATAWYGLHPANAETVNYIIQRGDIYSTLGVVGGLALYAWLPRWRKTGVYLIPVVLGVLSKPPALVFPALLFLYIFYFEENANRGRMGEAVRKIVPALLVCAALAWLQAAMTPKSFTPAIISGDSYRITQPFVWMRYFGSFFLPLHLNADTDLQPFDSVNGEALAGFLFVAALIAAAYIAGRRARGKPISFGLLWFMIALLPTSLYPLSEAENDHRMFFPFVGLALSVCWAIALCVEAYGRRHDMRIARRVTGIGCLCALAAYGCGTWKRNQVWLTDESLWHDVTLKSPRNGRGLMNYGLTQMAKGQCSEALNYFKRALEFTPNYPTLEVNLGVANGCLGHAAAAEQHFQRAIALAPADYQTHYYYGRWLNEIGRFAEAAGQLATAVQLNPAWSDSRVLLAKVLDNLRSRPVSERLSTPEDFLNASLHYHQARKYRECIDAARQALRLRPNYPEAYNNIAAAYEAMGNWDEAIAAANQALRLRPDYQLAKNNLAWSLAQKRASQTGGK